MKWKKPACICIAVIGVCASLALLTRLLMPKYMTDVVEGAMISEYYGEEKSHDVVFVGDCELYENFDPVCLWENYGINSYIRGSAQQLIWQSYYLMEETLKYERPKVFVFNVLAMQYDKPQKEAYNRMTLDGMRFSVSKLSSVRASMLPEESLFDYLFPLLRYHSRWKELSGYDTTYFFRRHRVTHNGYYMRLDVKPAENVPEGKPLPDYSFGENAYLYLDRMVSLCRPKGISLILVKAPSLYPYWYDEWDRQMEEYAARYGIEYINFLDEDILEETGLDFSTDTYDGGLHLNRSGADKVTAYFGELLREGSEEYRRNPLPDRREDEDFAGSALEQAWEEKLAAYNADIAWQKEKGAQGSWKTQPMIAW